jgi:hypothetical protein
MTPISPVVVSGGQAAHTGMFLHHKRSEKKEVNEL